VSPEIVNRPSVCIHLTPSADIIRAGLERIVSLPGDFLGWFLNLFRAWIAEERL
jgi:hypothetical protein